MTPFVVISFIVVGWIMLSMWRRQIASRREAYIRSFVLPTGLFEQLRKTYPQLSLKECQLVANGLRQFFLAHLKSGRKFVAMPSQVTDELWHELILFTKNYDAFCRKAFGHFLHHTPAVELTDTRQSNAGLRRCWWYVCKEDNINPRKPTRLPLLFALDTKLKIPNGFKYVADCRPIREHAAATAPAVHCGSDFANAAYDGGTSGFGDSSSDSSSSSGSSDSTAGESFSGGGGDSGGGGASGSSCGGGGCGGGGGGDS